MSRAVAKAPALSAEVRLVQALSEFAALLPEQQRVVFKSLQRGSPPGPSHVIRVTEEINRDGAQQHRAWQQQGTRFVGILDRVQLFAKVGDILVGGSQNMIATGVWAVIRLSLQVAVGYLTFFDKVSTFFMHVGRASAIQKDLALLFPDCQELQACMCEYLLVLVEVCGRVVQYTKKGSLGILSASLFTSFDKEFADFEDRLQRWATMINQRVLYLSTKANSQNQSLLIRASQQSFDRQDEARQTRILHRLSPHQASFDLAWRKERKKGAVAWIFREDAFDAWKSSKESSVLWLSGSIGSGKTVVLANIIGHVHIEGGAQRVAFFFCDHSNQHSLKAVNIISSIACQLIRPLIAEGAVLTVDQRNALYSMRREEPETVIQKLATLLPKTTEAYIVIDALDECDPDEASEVLVAVQGLLATFVTRVCLSSRKDSSIIAMASRHFTVHRKLSMASLQRIKEMAEYIDAEISRRNTSGAIDSELQALIRDTLTERADGMQIEALFPRYTEHVISDLDIFRTLEMLPKDLPEAFRRALEGVRDERYGRTIFELVAAAKRPLTAEELRVALNVEPGIAEWNSATLAYNAHLLVALCSGGLLEIEEESETVHYIHFSALQYLMEAAQSTGSWNNKYHVDPVHADIKLGSICVTYLSYADFETQLAANRVAMVDVTNVTDRIVNSIFPQESVAGRFVTTALRNLRVGEQREVNMGHAIQDYLQRRQKNGDIHGLMAFARRYWLEHTKLLFLDPTAPSWRLFRKLVFGTQEHVIKPWKDALETDGLRWSLQKSHNSLIHLVLNGAYKERDVMGEIVRVVTSKSSSFRGHPLLLGQMMTYFVNHGAFYQDFFAVLVRNKAQLREDPTDGGSVLATTIEQASQRNNLDGDLIVIVELLLRAGAAPLPGLCAAVKAGWPAAVKVLLAASHPVRQETLSDLLSAAVKKSNLSIVDSLLRAGARADTSRKDEESLIQLAVRTGHQEMILLLAEHGAPLDAHGPVEEQPLIEMIRSGYSDRLTGSFHTALAVLKIAPKAPPRATLTAALHAAVTYGIGQSCVDLIQHLLDAGAEYDRPLEGRPYTPVAESVVRNNAFALECLLRNGASPDVSFGSCSAPALALACQKRFRETVNVLIKHGVDVNAKGTDGLAALHYAVATGDVPIVKALLEAQADLNATSDVGVRPINQAVDMAHAKIISLLLEHGAGLDSVAGLGDAASHPLLRACSLIQEPIPRAFKSGPAERQQVIRQLLSQYDTAKGLEPAYQLAARQLNDETFLYFILKGLDLHSPLFSASPEYHPLVEATRRGMDDIARDLAEQSEVDILSHALWAAIHYSRRSNKIGIVHCLLNAGADPGFPTPDWIHDRWKTLLLAALKKADDEVAVALIEAGCPFKVESNQEAENPILRAANYGRSKAFAAMWEQSVAGSVYEREMLDLVANVIGPLGALTDMERRNIAETAPDGMHLEGKELILAYLESCRDV